MDAGDIHLKEYERALQLLDNQERNLDRLALVRTLFLIVSVLFLQTFLRDLEQVRSLCQVLRSSGESEQNATVFGYLLAHQRIENLVFVPDEKAKALIELIPKIGAFLGEELTLDNQSSRPVSEILEKARSRPERIRIENPYLPKLSVPVSHTAMALLAFWTVMGSFFYFSYRRFQIGILNRYISFHLARLREIVGGKEYAPPMASPRVIARGVSAATSDDFTFQLIKNMKQLDAHVVYTQVVQLLRRLASRSIANSGRSPFRFLNAVFSAVLFVALAQITARIVVIEGAYTPHWYSIVAVTLIITVVPVWFLQRLCSYFRSRYSESELSFLPTPSEL